ncbi:hypothetical protein INT47_012190 [Mucor saturninus]|uniref:VLRF1 domain-containing protein n=1 Tax=Mucor saturninus TaxID=64648 RepID=A0A8H7QXC9_9FUNG|nr:hypothetical protein INT47_012190 [Mucor saturninus]
MSDYKKRQQEALLYAINLPKDLLESLEPVEKETEALLDIEEKKDETINALALERLQLQQDRLENGEENSTNLTCNTCAISFNEREEQRTHFNTDWHRYNIKRRVVLDVKPVSLEEFEILLSDLTESISGSEEDDSEEEDNDLQKDNIHSLVQKQKKEQEEKELLLNDAKQVVLPMMKKYSALNWYKQSNVKDSSHYGVYRHLFNSTHTTLKSIQQSNFANKKRTWTILMLGGGHFAGCVIDVNASKGAGEKSIDKQVQFVTHKTFHRYTTRRKQGGSQSANDNAKGAANSAGAQIRRHNEQLLEQEVREVISQWRQHILNSELVLVHAPSGNRKILFNYQGAVLDAQSVKSIPFVTRRPTLGELKRVYTEITTVKVVQVDEQAIESYKQKWIENQEKQKQLMEKSSTVSKKVKQVVEKNIDPDLEKLLELIKQNKTTVTLAFIQKHMNLPLSGLLPQELANQEDLYHYPTILHMVSNTGGAADLVTDLLIKYDADPTIVSDAGKTAYEVSKDKETRNAFRRCMCDYPSKWNWLEDARVPSPLTEKQMKDQEIKDKKKLAKEQEKKRLIELERQKIQEAREAKEAELKFEKVQATRAKNYMLPIVNTEIVNTSNMTPEARMRLEREKRARAAEERMKKK